jgi:pimeloyl-ACP methyl ester carboxylesterase
MIVAAATYRPKGLERNETDWLNAGAVSVTFESTDGLKISGFWTNPPSPTSSDIPNPRWGRQTLIICPGARGGRTSYQTLADAFLADGYNVLTFDFRGNGLSGGEIVSFGDHERRDVLGAVKWLRENQPSASRRIVAVGIDTGAAALIAAAADRSDEGRAVNALAVFGCYDRFTDLAASAAAISFPPPLQWLIVPVALPLGCVQTGADLWHFAPADLVCDVAPRPILFIHGRRDPVIAFERGVSLYDAASVPKAHIWLDDSTDDEAINDPSVVNRVRHFLNTAVPML